MSMGRLQTSSNRRSCEHFYFDVSPKLRTQSLENRDWTLKQVLDKGRAMELSERQAGIIERGETSVNRVQTNKYTSKPSSNRGRARKNRRDNPKHVVDVAIHTVAILRIAPHTDKHVRDVRKLTTTRNTAKHHPKTQKLRRSHQDGGGEGTRGLTS